LLVACFSDSGGNFAAAAPLAVRPVQGQPGGYSFPHFPMQPLVFILLFLNALCFLLFFLDKQKARRGQRRIAEKTLHLATLAGAAPGAWAAILLLHHKNRKASFWGITLLLTVVQGVACDFVYASGFLGRS
jgi:uncharacterized membrane protein YsdA (DUF1294 family)